MQLVTDHRTRAGGRRANEDALMAVSGDAFTLLVLADGLGGHGDGAVAAQECVDTVAAVYSREPGLSDATLQALVDAADSAVAKLRLDRGSPATSMRTTLALLAVFEDAARWAHVGDSRVYWFRDSVLMQRTRDHSVAEMVENLPDGAPVAPPDEVDRNRLLRAVGAGRGCRAEVGDIIVTLQVGDAFLLCSDGLWSLVTEDEMAACLAKSGTADEWCNALEQRLQHRLDSDPGITPDDFSIICGMVV